MTYRYNHYLIRKAHPWQPTQLRCNDLPVCQVCK